jgi:uncharacterized protein YggE
MKSLLVVLCLVSTVPIAVGQWYVGTESSNTDGVTAAGEVEIRVVPDLVEIALGVETRDSDLARARELNDTATAAVIAEAKRHGVDAAHITTDYLSIEPGYSVDALKPHVYFVRKSILVTSTDVASFESLFPALLTAGANHVHRVRFMTSELRRRRDEARAQACKAARDKAQLLARNLGRTLGEVRRITESSDDWWSSYGSWWGGGGSSAQNVVQSAGASAASEQSGIAPGQLSIRSRVTVTFDLR